MRPLYRLSLVCFLLWAPFRLAAQQGKLKADTLLVRRQEFLRAARNRAASAIDSIREAAGLELAEAYTFGLYGIKQSGDSARKYAGKAADRGNPAAEYLLGTGYVRGLPGYVRNTKKGLALLDAAAKQKQAFALNVLTELYSDTLPDPFTPAQYRVPTNRTKAFGYALQAAELGNSKAELFVGRAYLRGFGVKRNDSLALQWLLADWQQHRDVLAELALGDLYLKGTTRYGVDLDKATYFYTLAKDHLKAQVEDQAAGEVGLFNTEMTRRRVFNITLRMCPLLAPGVADLRIRL